MVRDLEGFDNISKIIEPIIIFLKKFLIISLLIKNI